MKVLSLFCEDIKSSMIANKALICEYVSTPSGIIKLEDPILSSEKSCDWCGGTECYCPFVDPKISNARTWLCAKTNCDVYKALSCIKTTQTTPKPQRSLEWAKFCEINDIGDIFHTVKFEDIQQSQAKISFMIKFVSKPQGILHMQGDPGTGKTYSAMAMCELYTRKHISCIFTTQKRMSSNWLETFNKEGVSNYVEKITNCSLLVIDDFGTAEVATGFMSFFMDLINTRLQWSNRGTVITTNLNDKTFATYCGEALADRIMTGQIFSFEGKTRRKKIIL